MNDGKDHFATLREYIDYSVQPREGAVTRDQAKESLSAIQDGLEWTEQGVAEWRGVVLESRAEIARLEATARIATRYLYAVTSQHSTPEEQKTVAAAARDWLVSIGEPS